MKLKVVRTDGGTGAYAQADERQSRALLWRLHPDRVFLSGPITIGIRNPFTVLNPDEICWIEVASSDPPQRLSHSSFDRITLLADRTAFEASLAQKWMRSMSLAGRNRDGLFEAFVELRFRGGRTAYLDVVGRESMTPAPEVVFTAPAIVADAPDGTVHYINPRALVRSRVYHSRMDPELPDGLWFAEAEEI